MTAILAHIFRHPIKSIGHEEIRTASLEEGRVLPLTGSGQWRRHRRNSMALDGVGIENEFRAGAAAPGLMAVAAQTHGDGKIELTHPDLPLADRSGHACGSGSFDGLAPPTMGDNHPAPRGIERPGVALTDQREARISILSLSSLADFERRTGVTMSPHRFRGNLWVSGWAPWAERDLVGQTLRIGSATIEIVEPIGRCRATNASPETGTEDLDTLAALRSAHGDQDFGLFGNVTGPGVVTRGDEVEIL